MSKLLIGLIFIALLSGCAGSRTFEGMPLDHLQLGITSEQDVRSELGSPFRQVFNDDWGRNEEIIYRTFEQTSDRSVAPMSEYSGMPNAAVRKSILDLHVFFDKEGAVSGHRLRRTRVRDR